MINTSHLRKLIADIFKQQSDKWDFFAKIGLEPFDFPSDFDAFLSSKDENGLVDLSKQVIQACKPSPTSRLLAACLNQNTINPESRKKLVEELLLLAPFHKWCGQLGEIEFLKRVWELDAMASTDPRYSTASRDIFQHMVNNDDWSSTYLLFDYLGLDTEPDHVFEQFCQELAHPLVRENQEEQALYVRVINKHLAKHNRQLSLDEEMLGYAVYKCVKIHSLGVQNKPKNLIFASIGPKPDIVLKDAINNDIMIVKNGEFCLVYDLPIPQSGLTFQRLNDWWMSLPKENPAQRLSDRLKQSLGSEPEKIVFDTYCQLAKDISIDKLPALIPQVYLHYDPYTLRELQGSRRLPRQRMDFLLLFSERERVVIEVDGKQHYADEDKASPAKYSEMVAADRELKLYGYEVFRFGGYELRDTSAGSALVQGFFRHLLRKYGVLPR